MYSRYKCYEVVESLVLTRLEGKHCINEKEISIRTEFVKIPLKKLIIKQINASFLEKIDIKKYPKDKSKCRVYNSKEDI